MIAKSPQTIQQLLRFRDSNSKANHAKESQTMSNATLPRLDMPARGKSAAIVTTPQGEFFFSYRTVIAFRGEDKDGNFRKVRLDNYWSRTTGRHFTDLGCKGFDIVTPEEFAKVIGYTGGNPQQLTERV